MLWSDKGGRDAPAPITASVQMQTYLVVRSTHPVAIALAQAAMPLLRAKAAMAELS